MIYTLRSHHCNKHYRIIRRHWILVSGKKQVLNTPTHEYLVYSTNPESTGCLCSVAMYQALTCEALPHVTPSAARFNKLAGTNPTESVFSARTTHQEACSSLLRTFMTEHPDCTLHILDLCSSGILRNVEWYFCTDVSGQPIGPIFKGQEVQ
jgi:hypothetical protein